MVARKAERVTVDQLLDVLEADLRLRGKLSKQIQSHIKPLRTHFGAMRANEVKAQIVTVYIEALIAPEAKGESYARASVNRRSQPALPSRCSMTASACKPRM